MKKQNEFKVNDLVLYVYKGASHLKYHKIYKIDEVIGGTRLPGPYLKLEGVNHTWSSTVFKKFINPSKLLRILYDI